MPTTRFDAPAEPDLDDLYRDVADADLQPLWLLDWLMPNTPPIADVPHLWSCKTLRALAERAGQLVPVERGGDRRVLALANPGLGGAPFATTTLWGAVQYLGPGEVAPAHRHTPGALRFVIEGSGVWTLVNGDPVGMTPGDLVLTPSWSWHEHHNSSDEPMVWFDGLDIPMVRALDAVFYESGSGEMVRRSVDPVSRAERRYAGGPGLVPADDRPVGLHSPLLAYRWNDTDRALAGLLDDVDDGATGHVAVRFADPSTGADVMPTLRCEMHRLVPHRPGRPAARRAGSSVWVMFRGSCTAAVGDRDFQVEPGDVFVVPSWSPLRFECREPSDLFCLSDAPLLEALGLDREG